ncbi:cytochrome P450 4C1 [Tribolium castaneum]|uniref:Cytochrome P450-like protein n=1 Tax=Tribolium castaneum TaxID=7070 RepID=D6WKN7_TRICA|nr:PREDICTED: cytochrome P450 4C1 [Tribolium castaneum]EFA04535.1 cytochrome P450-like protein [Tribolium castaneum]|eukprot:XP_971612.1 PREDICTED: cytochrome P450 4C1 [Tribolium castaneum]
MNIILEFFSALAVIIVLSWWYLFLKNYKVGKFFKNFSGPPGVPLLGNALDFKNKTKGVLPAFLNYNKNFGGLVKVQIGPFRKLLLVSDYKFLEFVLSSTKIINKSQNYRTMLPWLGTGLLTSEGIKWKKHRRIITPTFHFKILEQFINSFDAAGDVMINKLRKKVGIESVDIYPFVTLCALDIICETAMGTTINAQNNEESEYVTSVKEMGRIIIERAIAPQKNNEFLFRFTKDYQLQKSALKVLHNYTNNVISKRREELLKDQASKVSENVIDMGIKKKMAFLDLLLQATVDGRPLTNEEIREEVDTFMFEGHDTTASGISFALYCLANNPEAQEKAYEEQVALFGKEKKPIVSYSDLQEMKYLELVIKEALRLYPSVPFYARETNQEVEFGDIKIPKGVNITIFAYGIHRDPKYFPEPDKFDPGRFETIDGKLPYAYIPFSAGPRNCIGQKFAMLEMKSTISKVLRNFKLCPATPHHTLDLVAETVLKSDNGVRLSLMERQ